MCWAFDPEILSIAEYTISLCGFLTSYCNTIVIGGRVIGLSMSKNLTQGKKGLDQKPKGWNPFPRVPGRGPA